MFPIMILLAALPGATSTPPAVELEFELLEAEGVRRLNEGEVIHRETVQLGKDEPFQYHYRHPVDDHRYRVSVHLQGLDGVDDLVKARVRVVDHESGEETFRHDSLGVRGHLSLALFRDADSERETFLRLTPTAKPPAGK